MQSIALCARAISPRSLLLKNRTTFHDVAQGGALQWTGGNCIAITYNLFHLFHLVAEEPLQVYPNKITNINHKKEKLEPILTR